MTPEDFADVVPFDWFEGVSQIELMLGQSNIYPRVNRLAIKGDITNGHAHNFDHVTFCARGRVGVEAEVNGQIVRTIVPMGSGCLIKKGVIHKLIGLENDTCYVCLYAHHTAQGDVQQTYTGWPEAYS